MTDAHDLPAAIQWHEGMLLAPQHFQQMGMRQEELLHYHFNLSAPFHWGIRHLLIDPVLLIEGTFRILELEAVMPDGLVVSHRPEDKTDLEIDLTAHTEEMSQKAVVIQLVVPATKIEAAGVKGVLPRYNSIEGKPVVDENTGESELEIPRLKPRVSLLVADTSPQKYTAFPLAEIAYKNETFALTDFMPAFLSVPVESKLGEMCALISKRLREKSVFLSEKITSPSSTIRGAMTLETKLLINGMVSGLPHFEAVLNTGVSHPYALYLSLCSLVGNLAVLSGGLVPQVLAPYNHNNIYAAYEQAKEFLFRMIDEGILESHTAVPFDYENGIFNLNLKKDWITKSIIIGARRKAGIGEKELIAWLDESLIGSEKNAESMKEKRIRGAARKKIEGDGELVPVRNVVLFSITFDREFIAPDTLLQVFNTSDMSNKFGPSEIMLYVKNK